MSRIKRATLWIAGLGLVFLLAIVSQLVCLSAFLRHGILVETCPSGAPRPFARLNAWSLRRGNPGTVELSAAAFYTTGPADLAESATLRRSAPTLELLVGEQSSALVPKDGWKEPSAGVHHGEITLPAELPDGDHQLRATLDTPLGRVTTTAPLPVYAPAKIHLLSDRPLYEPGNLIQFRALVLRARDLVPLDGRPGRFIVTSPSGEVMLEERASAGRYGVVAGTFPLDRAAETGRWSLRWVSGSDEAAIDVTVEPFTLPRFRLELEPNKPFYGRGDQPKLSGRVVYSSGAPVARAQVTASWRVFGAWPAPMAWMQGALPTAFRTDPQGRFQAELPRIPMDLVGRATLHADLEAIDESGDRVGGAVDLLLSEDAIQIEAMTELAGGLVQGFNNRVFLRAATAHGVVLPKTELVVRRAWEPQDPGTKVTTDEDGVASLQFDPGPPVNVITPGVPQRRAPRPPPFVRTEASEQIQSGEPSLADLASMDGWHRSFAPCARLATEAESEVGLVVRVASDGRVIGVVDDDAPLSRCMKRVIAAGRLGAGSERLFVLGYQVRAEGPRLVAGEAETFPESEDELSLHIAHALAEASTCLPPGLDREEVPYTWVWHLAKGTRVLGGPLVRARDAEASWPEGVVSCVRAKLAKVELRSSGPESDDEVHPASTERFGVVRLAIEGDEPGEEEGGHARRPDTVRVGYELHVRATTGSEVVGETKVFLSPGAIPPLRIRATPTFAKPGDEIEVSYLRGPGFSGELPKEPVLSGDRWRIESKLDEKARGTRFKLPADAAGWFITEWSGARAMVYVKPGVELELSVRPERPEYRPGEQATLLVTTKQAGRGHPAAVGLFGVDESLGQLAALPGPGELERLREVAPNEGPAFGVLEVAALQMGRVRGENAREALLLRVSGLPPRAELDAYASANSEPSFEPLTDLTDNFYRVLEELHRQVRRWEETAPKEQSLDPPRLAGLWREALTEAKAKGVPVTDAYGRELRLFNLPEDLLALTEPRAVVSDGTRLPEDMEDWASWVQKERP